MNNRRHTIEEIEKKINLYSERVSLITEIMKEISEKPALTALEKQLKNYYDNLERYRTELEKCKNEKYPN